MADWSIINVVCFVQLMLSRMKFCWQIQQTGTTRMTSSQTWLVSVLLALRILSDPRSSSSCSFIKQDTICSNEHESAQSFSPHVPFCRSHWSVGYLWYTSPPTPASLFIARTRPASACRVQQRYDSEILYTAQNTEIRLPRMRACFKRTLLLASHRTAIRTSVGLHCVSKTRKIRNGIVARNYNDRFWRHLLKCSKYPRIEFACFSFRVGLLFNQFVVFPRHLHYSHAVRSLSHCRS